MVERTGATRRASNEEAGFTLVELLVAMSVFAVFLTMIVSSVIAISAASARAQLVARSSNGVLVVFQNLDRQIRYADSINFPGPGVTAGSRYVEFRVPASSASSGVATCMQWRYWPATKSIQSRQWPESGTPSATWATKVSNVIDTGAAGYPFKLTPATTAASGPSTQQLVLSISSGTASLTSGASISSNFVARNSSTNSRSNSNLVVAGVSDTPVCTSSGSRP
jgi:prepilin-type N-terminal cleavage/methylation domain-containing protein